MATILAIAMGIMLVLIINLQKTIDTQQKMIDGIYVHIYDETGVTIMEIKEKLKDYYVKDAMDKVIGR